MMVMGIQQQLTPEELGKGTYFPPTCHTLSKKENKFLQVFARYQTSPRVLIKHQKLLSMKDLNLISLKSHDYHVSMRQLLLWLSVASYQIM